MADRLLKNGVILKDDGTVENGVIIKNTSGFTPFIYNVVDEDGETIQTVSIGTPKMKLYTVEVVK